MSWRALPLPSPSTGRGLPSRSVTWLANAAAPASIAGDVGARRRSAGQFAKSAKLSMLPAMNVTAPAPAPVDDAAPAAWNSEVPTLIDVVAPATPKRANDLPSTEKIEFVAVTWTLPP